MHIKVQWMSNTFSGLYFAIHSNISIDHLIHHRSDRSKDQLRNRIMMKEQISSDLDDESESEEQNDLNRLRVLEVFLKP